MLDAIRKRRKQRKMSFRWKSEKRSVEATRVLFFSRYLGTKKQENEGRLLAGRRKWQRAEKGTGRKTQRRGNDYRKG